MGYNKLNKRDIETLRAMVAPDRFSTGESNLNLHSRDQSSHPPSLPEAVIWPVNEAEIVNIFDNSWLVIVVKCTQSLNS